MKKLIFILLLVGCSNRQPKKLSPASHVDTTKPITNLGTYAVKGADSVNGVVDKYADYNGKVGISPRMAKGNWLYPDKAKPKKKTFGQTFDWCCGDNLGDTSKFDYSMSAIHVDTFGGDPNFTFGNRNTSMEMSFDHLKDSFHKCPVGEHWREFIPTTAIMIGSACMPDSAYTKLLEAWDYYNCGETDSMRGDSCSLVGWTSTWDPKTKKCTTVDFWKIKVNGKWRDATEDEYEDFVEKINSKKK